MNFQLFKNFREAAKICNIPVTTHPGYYSISIPNTNRYIYCWTPLNKLPTVFDAMERNNTDEALQYLEEWCNFHLEIDSTGHMENVMEAFLDANTTNASVEEIIDIIKALQDDKKIEEKLIWIRLKYDN